MSHNKDVAGQFIATYYPMVIHNYAAVKKFYNSHAKISRFSCNSSITFKIANEPIREVCPEEFISGIVKVFSHSFQTINDNLLVTAYGTVAANQMSMEYFFSQEFVLQRFSGKWFIINDVFYCYKSYDVQLLGAEQALSIPLQGMPPHAFISQPQPPVPVNLPMRTNSTYVPSKSDGQRKSRLDTFDISKSITISELSKTYVGQDVVSIFQKYGTVRSKYFTHGTVYIEYDAVESKNAALHSPPPIIKGQQCKVDDGIIRPR